MATCATKERPGGARVAIPTRPLKQSVIMLSRAPRLVGPKEPRPALRQLDASRHQFPMCAALTLADENHGMAGDNRKTGAARERFDFLTCLLSAFRRFSSYSISAKCCSIVRIWSCSLDTLPRLGDDHWVSPLDEVLVAELLLCPLLPAESSSSFACSALRTAPRSSTRRPAHTPPLSPDPVIARAAWPVGGDGQGVAARQRQDERAIAITSRQVSRRPGRSPTAAVASTAAWPGSGSRSPACESSAPP